MTLQFDHEKLDVYQLTLGFVAWATDLMAELQELPEIRRRRIAEVFDHLDRASLSILFNTAEGNGKRVSRLRGRFFDDARGSATECAACLDALVAKRACEEARVAEGKQLLVRIASMLTRLVFRFAPDGRVREIEGVYRVARGKPGASVARTDRARARARARAREAKP